MIKIKFNDSQEFHTINNFYRVNENIIRLDIVSNDTSGFVSYIDGVQVGDFSNFNHIYRKYENATEFSNDGSEYVEPTTIIKATFDGDKPEKVEVLLSTGDKVVLSGTFTKEVKGDYVAIASAEQLDDYNLEINGATAIYTLKPESQKIKEQVDKLKAELASTDYEALKYAEGWFTDEEYAPIKARRENLREQIRALQN